RNADYAAELEDLLTSLREVVQQNTALEAKVEEISATKEADEGSESSAVEDADAEAREEEMSQLRKENDDLTKRLQEEAAKRASD
ncbi:hypothetical protein ACHAWF_009361, partial [Thalassiosira exigua]